MAVVLLYCRAGKMNEPVSGLSGTAPLRPRLSMGCVSEPRPQGSGLRMVSTVSYFRQRATILSVALRFLP
jgi:hypothetical protein